MSFGDFADFWFSRLGCFCAPCCFLSVGLFIISHSLSFVKRFFKTFLSFFQVFRPRFRSRFSSLTHRLSLACSLAESLIIISHHPSLVNTFFQSFSRFSLFRHFVHSQHYRFSVLWIFSPFMFPLSRCIHSLLRKFIIYLSLSSLQTHRFRILYM